MSAFSSSRVMTDEIKHTVMNVEKKLNLICKVVRILLPVCADDTKVKISDCRTGDNNPEVPPSFGTTSKPFPPLKHTCYITMVGILKYNHFRQKAFMYS